MHLDSQMATKQDVLQLELKMADVKADIIKWVVGIGIAQSALLMSFITPIKFLH